MIDKLKFGISCSLNGWSTVFTFIILILGRNRSHRPRGLRSRPAAARLLRSWVRIPPGEGMSVCCDCCVLSGRGLSDELFPRPEESYRLWCVVVCDLKTSRMRRPWPTEGCCTKRKKERNTRWKSRLTKFLTIDFSLVRYFIPLRSQSSYIYRLKTVPCCFIPYRC